MQAVFGLKEWGEFQLGTFLLIGFQQIWTCSPSVEMSLLFQKTKDEVNASTIINSAEPKRVNIF